MGAILATPVGHFLATASPGQSGTFEGIPGGQSGLKKRAEKFGATVKTERVVVVGGTFEQPTTFSAIRITILDRNQPE